jgi:hypothetical protein
MSVIEDKVRRRLAPFVVEGKIAAPQFSAVSAPSAEALMVNVRLKSAPARNEGVEAALRNAIRDLGADAQLVISAA